MAEERRAVLDRRDLLRGAGAVLAAGVALPLLAACGASGGNGGGKGGAKSGSEPIAPSSATSYPPAPSSPLGALTAPYTATPPSIKGVIDSSWSKAQKYVISGNSSVVQQVGSLFKTTPPMTSSTVYQMWDANNFYVAEERVNTSAGLPITQPHVKTHQFLGNSLGVFFAYTDFSNANYTENGHYTAWLSPTGPDSKPHWWLRAGNSGSESDTFPSWPLAAKLSSTGYVQTGAIPWSALQAIPWKVGKGAQMAYTLLPTAAGPSGKPWGQIMLVGNGDTPSTWGVLTLA